MVSCSGSMEGAPFRVQHDYAILGIQLKFPCKPCPTQMAVMEKTIGCRILTQIMEQALTKEEKQFLWVCPNKDFNVSEFMSLLKQGVRLNIHDKIDHSVTNGWLSSTLDGQLV